MADTRANYYSQETINDRPVGTAKRVKGRARKKKKEKVNSRANAQATLKLLTMASVVLIMAILILYLLGYADITKTRMEINSLESYKTELEKSKVDLTADLEGIKSSTRISEDALYKLGMTYPEKGQIRYISVADEIETIKETKIVEKKDKNQNRIFSFFSGLF